MVDAQCDQAQPLLDAVLRNADEHALVVAPDKLGLQAETFVSELWAAPGDLAAAMTKLPCYGRDPSGHGARLQRT